jgi:hypothetical protein
VTPNQSRRILIICKTAIKRGSIQSNLSITEYMNFGRQYEENYATIISSLRITILTGVHPILCFFDGEDLVTTRISRGTRKGISDGHHVQTISEHLSKLSNILRVFKSQRNGKIRIRNGLQRIRLRIATLLSENIWVISDRNVETTHFEVNSRRNQETTIYLPRGIVGEIIESS